MLLFYSFPRGEAAIILSQSAGFWLKSKNPTINPLGMAFGGVLAGLLEGHVGAFCIIFGGRLGHKKERIGFQTIFPEPKDPNSFISIFAAA